jgi:hypothetical protein
MSDKIYTQAEVEENRRLLNESAEKLLAAGYEDIWAYDFPAVIAMAKMLDRIHELEAEVAQLRRDVNLEWGA